MIQLAEPAGSWPKSTRLIFSPFSFDIQNHRTGLMEAYKDWVRRNKDYVYSLESLASGMTWLLPERFSSSEIVPEAVSSVLGIITAVNQHIIDTIPRRWPMQPIQPVKHATIPYSLCISAFKEIEMLVEVIAEQLW